MTEFVYSILNITTNKIQFNKYNNTECKYYTDENTAIKRLLLYKHRGYGGDYEKGKFKLIRFKLVLDEEYNKIKD